MSHLNKLDHIWLLLILFTLILAVWLFTKALWLETAGGSLIVAIIAVATNKNGVASREEKLASSENVIAKQ